MGRKIVVWILLLLVLGMIPCYAIPNPAAVYCHELGYEYSIEETELGQVGICKFPDGSSCPGWAFFAGTCGEDWCYCKLRGYEMRPNSGWFGQAVCILPDGSEVDVLDLMECEMAGGMWKEGECKYNGDLPQSLIYNLNTDKNFSTIQSAIDDPDTKKGHTITVDPGICIENVKVTKSLTIISTSGNPADTIVRAADSTDPVFNVTASYVNIHGFTVKRASYHAGIYFYNACYSKVSNNICSYNSFGILLINSSSITIANNTCHPNNQFGIFFDDSTNNKLTGNVMVENGIAIHGNSLSDYTHEIDESNTANGKPVYYWKDAESGRISDGAGQVILVNCSNVIVENQTLDNASVGLQVAFSLNITVKNNNCPYNDEGIFFSNSISSNMLNNSCPYNRYGIFLTGSNNNFISTNKCSNNCEDGIFLENSTSNSVSNNICTNNLYHGICLCVHSDNNSISSNNCSNNSESIWLMGSNTNRIYDNTCADRIGILLEDSNDNSISNNNCSNNSKSIWLRCSNANMIYNNTCSYNVSVGIALSDSNANSITNNTCSSKNWYGISIEDSNKNILTGNIMHQCGIAIRGDSLSDYTHEIEESNTVNEKPVYYWKDTEERRIPDDAGQVILVNCSNIIVENQTLNNASVGIQVALSSSIIIKNNTCSNNNDDGIVLSRANNNCIINNICSNNNGDGILLSNSYYNSIVNNTCLNHKNIYYGDGIALGNSYYNSIINNTCSYNWDGIRLADSENNIITNNNCQNNKGDGISLTNSNNNSCISTNTCSYNEDDGISLLYSNNNSISNNNCSLNNRYGIFLSKSDNNSISNNTYTYNSGGIHLWWYSSDNRVLNNTCSYNNDGISLGGIFYSFGPNNNCIKNNTCSNNYGYGIYLQYSSENTIYHNEIINNTNQAYDDTGTNAWNSSYPYGGNYWGDYTEEYKAEYNGDPEDKRCGANQDQLCAGDGIWDKPYKRISGDANATDKYPLVSRYCSIPADKYIFIEKWTQRIVEVLDGDFCLCIDRPTYEYNASVGELYPYSVARVQVNDTLVGIYGNGTSLHVINGTGGGAASGLTGFYSIPFNDSELTIMAIYADGSAKIMFGTETRVLNPGDEWQETETQVKRSEETGALINESFVTVITNFGLWDKSKIVQHAVIEDIVSDPELYEGQKVLIDGEYRGWDCSGVSGPGVTRSDWCVRDETGIIYVTGLSPGLDYYPDDIGERVIVTGFVRVTESDIVYIEATSVEILKTGLLMSKIVLSGIKKPRDFTDFHEKYKGCVC